MKLETDDLTEAIALLNALNDGAARLGNIGPVPFILSSETWIYIEFDQDSMAHVLMDPPR